ncbi:MAG: Nitroreductase [Monoraphidium minutum]|nr:MAG: Nitroreductase [Monoraphidium minutum]
MLAALASGLWSLAAAVPGAARGSGAPPPRDDAEEAPAESSNGKAAGQLPAQQRDPAAPDAPATAAAAAPPPLPDAAALAAAIRARRSIFPQHYTPGGAVPQAALRAMLEAADWAPSHGRTYPWRFVVLGPKGIQEMQDVTEAVMGRLLAGAPDQLQDVLDALRRDRARRWAPVSHMIAICMRRQAAPPKLMPEWEEVAAVACAVQNMHLTASARGVACYWSSWHAAARDSPEMGAFLGLAPAAGDRCLGFLVCGTPAPGAAQAYRAARRPLPGTAEWRE